MKSNNITDTQARLGNILTNIANNQIESEVPKKIDKAISKVQIKTGVVNRFYPYIDKAQVTLDLTNQKVLCKILHSYGGNLMNLYTPSHYDNNFDEELHEPYIIPKGNLNVCVLNVQDSDDVENIILGYYMNEEFVGFNPAKPGNVKFTYLMEDGEEYWLKFGEDGFQYKLPSAPHIQVGSKFDEEGFKEVTYTKFGENYTRDELYSKTEIDEMFDELRREGLRPYLDNIYPVGSVYISVNENNPSEFLGGVWVKLENRFLLGSGTDYPLYTNGENTTDGEATHTLTQSEMPRHNHALKDGGMVLGIQTSTAETTNGFEPGGMFIGNKKRTDIAFTGGSGTSQSESDGVAHNNMPPYIVVNMWKRIE